MLTQKTIAATLTRGILADPPVDVRGRRGFLELCPHIERRERSLVIASAADGIVGLLLVFIALAAYFAPSVVAFARHHHQSNTVLVINLFLGCSAS